MTLQAEIIIRQVQRDVKNETRTFKEKTEKKRNELEYIVKRSRCRKQNERPAGGPLSGKSELGTSPGHGGLTQGLTPQILKLPASLIVRGVTVCAAECPWATRAAVNGSEACRCSRSTNSSWINFCGRPTRQNEGELRPETEGRQCRHTGITDQRAKA